MQSAAIRSTAKGITITLAIAARAGRDEIVGPVGDAIKIRLKAPPVEGRANEALLDLLAKRLDVPRSSLTIIAGATARRKVVQVTGITADVAATRLAPG